MAHELRTKPDAEWVNGSPVERWALESLDAKQFRGMNWDKGGAWAPLVPITIAGAGLVLTGPLEIKGQGVLTVAADAEFVLGDDDFEDLAPGHEGRARVLLSSTIPVMGVGAFPWSVVANLDYCAAQPMALTLVDSHDVETTPEFVVPLRVHNGAKLDKVIFHFRVPELRTRSPEGMPKFRVFRRDKSGNVAVLKSTALGDGFESPENPGSAAAWYAGGGAKTFEYTCDQNNVIDVSQYSYHAHVVEEGGALDFPWRVSVHTATDILTASCGDASDSQPDGQSEGKIVFDGVDSDYAGGGIAPPVPFIYKDNAAQQHRHGLWHPGTGINDPWTRTTGYDSNQLMADAHGRLFVIGGVAGYTRPETQSGTVWQLSTTKPCVLGQSPINFAPAKPRGNIYTCVEAHFSGITSTAWQ